MRTLKHSLLVIAAAILALLLAAACGGDGDNGDDSGTAEVELPSPGEYDFAVTGTMEIEITEDQVSAAPVTIQEEDTQTVDLTGDATINFETGEFNIAQFGISGKITLGGEETDIQVNQNPDTPSTGQTSADETKLDLYFEMDLIDAIEEMQVPSTLVMRTEGPVRLQADGPWNFTQGTTGQGPPFILETPDDSPPVQFNSPSGDTYIITERAMSLSFTPAQPGEVDQDGGGDEEPTLSQEEKEFRAVVGPFGLNAEQFFRLRNPSDPVDDLIFSISGTPPGVALAQHDIIRVFAGIFDMTGQGTQAAFGNTVFPCDTIVDGTRTVCPSEAGPVPAGELVVLAMVLDGKVPAEDPDHYYTYAAVFDADGAPANNFQYVDPYDWDFFQGTDRWYQLNWDPLAGQWQVSVFQEQQDVASSARVVIDGRVIIFFIPADEFGVARPDYRLTAFAHDGTFAPEASGGDVSGADPTDPLLELPEKAIEIEEVEDVAATDGG